MGQLVLGCQFSGQLAESSFLHDHAEDKLVQALGQQEFGQAPLRFCPGGRDDEYHSFTTIGRAPQRFLPALTGS